jgi:hypothetical protein
MEIIVLTFAIAFAAFCIWLTVRIINRRERWAKRTAVAIVVALPALYALSFGPACWLSSQRAQKWSCPSVMRVYWPMGWSFSYLESARQRSGNPIYTWTHQSLTWWMTIGIPPGKSAIFPTEPNLGKTKVIYPPE